MRIKTMLGTLLLIAGCSGSAPREEAPASAANPPSTSGAEASEPLTFEAAIELARAHDPSSLPIEVELEEEDGQTYIEVEMIRGDEVIELYYDPETRTLAREAVEELDAEEEAALPTLRQHLTDGTARLEDVLALARRQYTPEELREVELEMHGDQLVMEVAVVRDGTESELIHDPQSGELLGEEHDDDEAQ